MFNRLPGDTDAAGSGTMLWKPLFRIILQKAEAFY
jgi:hypothetical protein